MARLWQLRERANPYSGAIQPHGVLVATRGADLTITHARANLEEFFGASLESCLGASYTRLLDAEFAERMARVFEAPRLRELNPSRVLAKNGRALDAVAHRSGDVLIIEMEPAPAQRMEAIGSFDPRLRSSVLRLQNAHDIPSLTATAAEEVRVLTGLKLEVGLLDIGALLATAVDSSSVAFASKRLVHRDLPSNVSMVRGDARRLRQVISKSVSEGIEILVVGLPEMSGLDFTRARCDPPIEPNAPLPSR